MSFCQNSCHSHQNHHCIHAHNCTSHDHKNARKNCRKQKKIDLLPAKLNKSNNKLHKIMQETQQQKQCHFNENFEGYLEKKICHNCKKLSKNLQVKNTQMTEIRKQNIQLERKNTKICDQNRQLHGVIQYYRGEMDRIIKCGDDDIKNQIKRHLKQNTELSVKNKFLLNKLNEVEQMVQKLAKQKEQLYKKINALKSEKQQLTISYNLLLEKLKKFKNEDSSKQTDVANEKKRAHHITQKYEIIIDQTNRTLQQNIRENKKLLSQNKELAHQVEILKSKLTNHEKMSRMEQESQSQREIVLKKKVEAYQKQIKQLREVISKLQQALKIKDQQLNFAKKVIQKQLKLIKQNKQLFQQLKNEPGPQITIKIDKQNIIPNLQINKNPINEGEKHKDQQPYINQLKAEIIKLNEKISLMEKQSKGNSQYSSQTIQQYILTIGASQAFKRIIEQKNQFIKKLIKEKGALLQKIV